ncbi:MAG TPA: hypothetical protein VIZ28_15905 [Chitinophagaceae bacterium]
MEQNQPTSLFNMQADGLMQSRLNSISKWGKFISITVLVIVILCAVAFAAVGERVFDEMVSLMGLDKSLAGALIAIFVLLMALIIAWLIFLLRASSLIKQGLLSGNSELLAEGFKALRIYFVLSLVMSLLSIIGTVTGMINS